MADRRETMSEFLAKRRKQAEEDAARQNASPENETPANDTADQKSADQTTTHATTRQKPGMARTIGGAWAGEVLKDTGAVGDHIVKKVSGRLREEAPTNSASSGAIAGLGAPGSSEPGVKKKKKAPRLSFDMFVRAKKAGE